MWICCWWVRHRTGPGGGPKLKAQQARFSLNFQQERVTKSWRTVAVVAGSRPSSERRCVKVRLWGGSNDGASILLREDWETSAWSQQKCWHSQCRRDWFLSGARPCRTKTHGSIGCVL